MIKDPVFCQNASCPNRDEGFFPDEMIKENGLLFCSADCLRRFQKATPSTLGELNLSDLKTLRYKRSPSSKWMSKKVRRAINLKKLQENHFISTDKNAIFSLRMIVAHRLYARGMELKKALLVVGYTKKSVEHRYRWIVPSKGWQFLEAGIIQ